MEPAAEPKVEVELLAAGEPAAYAALYARLARRLLRVAGVMLGDAAEAEAEDAVHDLFVALARGRERLRYVEDLDAYVFASLRHAIAARTDRQRLERRYWKSVVPTVAVESHSPEPAHDQGEVAAALAALPAEQREIVVMKIDGGLTFAQIAQMLAISPNTAASRYRYALEKLRKLLEDGS
jgi:RNA polymerase sigma-70 factor (ECF subfamily)